MFSMHMERYASQGTAWMSGLGSSGKRPDHIEESLHRAALSAKDVTHLQLAVSMLHCWCLTYEPEVLCRA